MPLVSTQEMLREAQEGGYAVGAFNVEGLEFVMAVLGAAEETRSPVIMQATPSTVRATGLDYLHAMVSAAAARASVPVALHLDHGDSFELCVRALRAGFTSVMIDGSRLPFEDNVALTESVCRTCAAAGVPVEAELGRVGGKATDEPLPAGSSPYTDPAEAGEFVRRTGCASLAIGVGTAHGVYAEEPHVALGVVEAVRREVGVPLVLHGASGVPDAQVASAVRAGICKVNYATELRQAYLSGFLAHMSAEPGCIDPKRPARRGMEGIRDAVASRMETLGCAGHAG